MIKQIIVMLMLTGVAHAQEWQNKYFIPENVQVEAVHVYRISGEEVNAENIYNPNTRVVDMNLLPDVGTYYLNVKTSDPTQEITKPFVIFTPGNGTAGLVVNGKYADYWLSLKSPDTEDARINRMLERSKAAMKAEFKKRECMVHSINAQLYSYKSNDAYKYHVFMDWTATCNKMDRMTVEIDLPSWFFNSAYVKIYPYLKGELLDEVEVEIE